MARVIAGRTDPIGAAIALRHQFADRPLPDKLQEVVSQAILPYGLRSPTDLGDQRVPLLAEALENAVTEDGTLPRQTLNALRKLGTALGYSEGECSRVLAQAGEELYARAVRRAVLDGQLTDEENAFLSSLASTLGISDQVKLQIGNREGSAVLTALATELLKDRRYSSDDERRLKQFATGLGANLEHSFETQRQLSYFRTLWEVENGNLPEVYAPIALQRGERCHYSCTCSWRELRTRTRRIDYAGVTGSVRIAKGVRFRVGSIAPRRITSTELVEIAAGTLYITSKRLLLDGQSSNKTLTWRSAFGMEVFSDAIKVEKNSGKDPHLFLPEPNIEMAAAIIAAAMSLGA
jgi:hypothetical protein